MLMTVKNDVKTEALIEGWQSMRFTRMDLTWAQQGWTLQEYNDSVDPEFWVSEIRFDQFTNEIESGYRHVCGNLYEGILDDDTYACCGGSAL